VEHSDAPADLKKVMLVCYELSIMPSRILMCRRAFQYKGEGFQISGWDEGGTVNRD